MTLMERMGLGVNLDLEDDMSREVDRPIRSMQRLERTARTTTRKVDSYNRGLADSFDNYYGRSVEQMQEMNAQFKGMGYALPFMTKRLNKATEAITSFNNATNRYQSLVSFNRALKNTMRVQRQLANMGYGASKTQQKQMDAKNYQMMNYQMQELEDRMNLTRTAIVNMQNAPDSSKFTKEIKEAQQALATYDDELRSVRENQRKFAEVSGYETRGFLGKEVMMKRGGFMERTKTRLGGLLGADMIASSAIAYKSLDKTAKVLTGVGNTAMEAKRKLTQLQGQMMAMGGMGTMFLSLPALLGFAGMGMIGNTFEKGKSVFQARTLESNNSMEGFRGYEDRMARVWTDTGARSSEVGKSYAFAQNAYGDSMDDNQVQSLTNAGLMFAKAWDVDANQAMVTAMDTAKKMGVSMDQSFDAYQVALMRTNGNHEKAVEYLKDHRSELKKLTGTTGEFKNAYEDMEGAMERGAIYKLMRALRQFGVMFLEIYEAMEPLFAKIADGLYRFADASTAFLRNNPKWAKFAGIIGLVVGGFLLLAPPILFLTGLLLRLRPIMEGISASMFGLARGGLAVLSPQARMAKDRFEAFSKAIGRFPQTLASVIPMLYTLIRGIPAFVGNMIKANPALAIAIGLLVAYKNNFAGFGDTVRDAGEIAKGAWNRLEDAYKNSVLPDVIDELKEKVPAFFYGLADGIEDALEVGTEFIDGFLKPLKENLDKIEPYLLRITNFFDRLFGGKGDAESLDDLLGETSKWESVGRVVGTLLTAFLGFKALKKILQISLLNPFSKLNNMLKTTSRRTGDLFRKMGIMKPRVGASGSYNSTMTNTVTRNAPAGTPYAPAPTGGQTRTGTNVTRGGTPVMSPMVPSMSWDKNVKDGKYRGSQVYEKRQSKLSRAMFGQKYYYNGEGGKRTFMSSGGIFSRPSMDGRVQDKPTVGNKVKNTMSSGMSMMMLPAKTYAKDYARRAGNTKVGRATRATGRGISRAGGAVKSAGGRAGRGIAMPITYTVDRLKKAGLLKDAKKAGTQAGTTMSRSSKKKMTARKVFGNVSKGAKKSARGIGKGLTKGLGAVVKRGIPFVFKAGFRLIPILGWALMAWDIIRAIFTNWDAIIGAGRKAWNWIKTDGVALLGSLWTWIKTTAGNVWNWIWGKAGEAWNWIKTDGMSILGAMWDTIYEWGKQMFNKVKTWATGKFEDIKASAVTWLSNMFEPIKTAWSSAKSFVESNPIVQTIKKVGSFVSNPIGTTANFIGNRLGLGGEKQYANGGFINRPHFGLVGEAGPEMIIPLSRKERGLDLWYRTGKMLGVDQFANGGMTSKAPASPTRTPSQGSKKQTPTSVDNSIQFGKDSISMEFNLTGDATQDDAQKHAKELLKEFKKLLKKEKLRGNSNITLEDLIASL